MKLKELLFEADANVFLKFYKPFEKGLQPEEHVADEALGILADYFEDYLKWYQKRPERMAKEIQVYNDFVKRLTEVKSAIRSNDLKTKITAVDNGINQWHIDYPVVAHLQMEVDDEEGEVLWDEVFQVLRALGRGPSDEPMYPDIQ